jgi:hypothetical protein
MRARLADALADAAHRQEPSAGYTAELEMWTGRYAGARDGVPRANIDDVLRRRDEPGPPAPVPPRTLAQPHPPLGHGVDDDAAELLVVVTGSDGVLDRLRAGEATSAVLLAASRLRLASTPLSQGVEVAATRRAIQRDVLHVPEHPQLVLRVGWPATGAAELPPTPRRGLRSVLLPA